MDNDIKQGILLFKCVTGYQGKPSLINNDIHYIIYYNDVNIGELFRENNYRWRLTIPSANIRIHGQNRIDLIDESEMRYRKFIKQ